MGWQLCVDVDHIRFCEAVCATDGQPLSATPLHLVLEVTEAQIAGLEVELRKVYAQRRQVVEIAAARQQRRQTET